MPADPSNRFQSVLSAYMENFLQEKHACGYAYREQTRILQRLDDFLVQEGLARYELPVSITRKWLAKKAHEDRKSTRLNSSHGSISYAVFCLKKQNEPAAFPRAATLPSFPRPVRTSTRRSL